jgi:hypothetical protein
VKKQISMIAFLSIVVLLAGCTFYIPSGLRRGVTGSGVVTQENRAVSEFNAVSLNGAGELTITQGEKESLVIEAEDNLLPLIKSQIRNGVLVIGFDSESLGATIHPTKPIKFDLSVKQLDSIVVAGAALVRSERLRGDRLTLTVDGAGIVKLNGVEATEVSTTMNGAGSVELAGNVVRQVATVNGLGNYQTHDLNSKNAQVTVSGAGGATLRADENLDVAINGAGLVTYYGNPRVSHSITGVGGVRRAGDQ